VRYQRTSRENPFLDLPKSGSLWGRDELDWLKVEDHCGLSPGDLLNPSADTPEEVESLSLLSQWMSVAWTDVKNGDFDLDLSAFYENLRDLGQKPVNIYASSSPHITSTPRPTALPVMNDCESNELDSSRTSTPRQKSQLNAEHRLAQSIPSSPPFRQAEPSSPILPTLLTPLFTNKTHVSPSDGSVYASDSTYIPSTPLALLSDPASSCYDKPEPDVVAAARGFLQLLRQAFIQGHGRFAQVGVHVQ
jgi:hypothetical protein